MDEYIAHFPMSQDAWNRDMKKTAGRKGNQMLKETRRGRLPRYEEDSRSERQSIIASDSAWKATGCRKSDLPDSANRDMKKRVYIHKEEGSRSERQSNVEGQTRRGRLPRV